MDKHDPSYRQLLQEIKSYLTTRYDLLRLELLDKLSSILGMLVLLVVALFFGFGVLAYLSVALVGWMAQVMPVSICCLIMAGVFLLCGIVIYLLRQKLFVNHFITWLSDLILDPDDDNAKTIEQGKEEDDESK